MARPRLYQSEIELESCIDRYFEITPKDEITITGIALHLGFESRQSLHDYEKEERFSYIIKRARLRVENQYERRLNSQTCTGAIFALKNMGWKDKVETGFTDGEGKDVNPVTLFQIPDNGRRTGQQAEDNKATEGVSGAGTEQPG